MALVNTTLLVIFRDVEGIKSATDMKIIPGLHLLLGSSENVKLLTFLSYFNPLSLWYLAVLAIAIRVFTGTDKTKACFGAIIIWLLSIAPDVVFVKAPAGRHVAWGRIHDTSRENHCPSFSNSDCK